jgi:teichoic acid transport system ATP-binding protein
VDTVIKLENVTKKYKLHRSSKEKVLDMILPKEYGEDFYALKEVTFEAKKGDIIGFVGVNGSGKSTLLNVIAGIIPETEGNVTVNGKTSVIAVSSGMKEVLTGRENIEMKCLMLGFSKSEIRRMEEEIIAFSELGRFIDQPVKSYSSGMKSRLGFAISISVDPEILIIDEALSVGDPTFSDKCLVKIKEFKESGKTILFVSHSANQIKKFCEKVLWLEYGKVREFGPADDVLKGYTEYLKEYKKMTNEQKRKYQDTHKYGGNGV